MDYTHFRREENRLLHLKYWQGRSIKDMQHLMPLPERVVTPQRFLTNRKATGKYRRASLIHHPIISGFGV